MPRQDNTGRRFRPAPVDVVAVAVLAAMMAYIFGWSRNFQEPQGPSDTLSGADYLQFYVAAQMVRHGHADRLYDFELTKTFQHDPAVIPYEWNPDVFGLYAYPPFFVWVCLPFSYLSYHAGAITWAVVMTGCFLGAMVLLLRAVPGGRRYFGLALLGCLIYRPLVMSIYTCQNATLSLLILVGSYVLLRARPKTMWHRRPAGASTGETPVPPTIPGSTLSRGRSFAAGVVFAALAFKPQLTLVLALVMLGKRQWRFVGGAIAGGLVLLAASLALSPSATLDYLRLAPHMSRWIDMPGMPLERMSCWYGFWRLLFEGWPLVYAQIATVVMTVATLVPLVWIVRAPFALESPRFALQYAALVLATVTLSPHLLSYDLTLLLIPLLLLAAYRPAISAPCRPAGTAQPVGRSRMLALALFLVAAVSEAVASWTRIQLIVPVMFAVLIVLATVAPSEHEDCEQDGASKAGCARNPNLVGRVLPADPGRGG